MTNAILEMLMHKPNVLFHRYFYYLSIKVLSSLIYWLLIKGAYSNMGVEIIRIYLVFSHYVHTSKIGTGLILFAARFRYGWYSFTFWEC